MLEHSRSQEHSCTTRRLKPLASKPPRHLILQSLRRTPHWSHQAPNPKQHKKLWKQKLDVWVWRAREPSEDVRGWGWPSTTQHMASRHRVNMLLQGGRVRALPEESYISWQTWQNQTTMLKSVSTTKNEWHHHFTALGIWNVAGTRKITFRVIGKPLRQWALFYWQLCALFVCALKLFCDIIHTVNLIRYKRMSSDLCKHHQSQC